MYAEALDCLSHHEETCMQDDSSRIVTAVTSYMKKSRSWSYCLTRARDCNCGSYAVTALENVYLNPYTDAEVSCSHFGSVYEMVKKTDFDRCLPSDHTYVSTSLKLFWSTQSDVCMELEAKQEKEMFCPLVPAFSTSSDCVNNCDTQDNCSDTTKCCPNECGGMSCLEPLEEDPKKQEPKPGYCPVFPRDAVGICPVECEIDQQCPEGQKCCKNPCGGPVCVDALDKEPLKPLECGENVPVPGCLDNPCDVTTCPNYDNAECRTAYCGGCHAQFIVDGVDVTNLCEDPEPIAECDPDKSEGTEGPCEDQDMGEKYYFNKETGQCEVFGYAGCEGNSNRFDTQMDCLQTCKPTCHLPMEYGDCNSHMEVWYFDYEKEDCVMFNFSGCGGNANRFPTKEACQMACANVMKFESACEIVKEELMSVVDEYTPFVDSLTDKLQCKFMMSEYRDISKSMLSECRLSTRAAEIVAEVENKIDFDWSMCEMDEEGDDKEEEDEEEEDMKCDLGEVDTQCVLPEVNENYDCQNLANYVACVKSLTNGCNLFQLIDLHGILTDHIESLTESGVTCEIDIPDRSDDPLMPVLDCLMPFKSIVTDALVEKFVPYGNAEDMCGAAEAMRTCVYGIPNLYAKPQVWKMLKIADEMHEQFCSELSLPMPESALECYVCEDETDNEECLKEMETCPINKMMCMTRVNLNIDGYTITKGCGNPEMIGKYDSWILLKDGFFYQYGCPGKLCNKDLRKEDVEETDKENEDEKQDEEGENDAGELVEPSETCLYKNLEPIVSGVLMKLTTKWFMADSDQKAFCSGEDMNAELELTTIKDSCSEEIAGQIDKVHMMFESLIAMVCPQDVEDEPTDAQCDWRKCIGPIVPYLRSNGSENECVHIKRGFDCLDDLLTECSQDDRVAIANGVIKVIRTIKGPQYCDMDLNDKFCVASRIDPTTVCDVSSAQACLNVQTSPFDSATVVCQKKKTKYDCVHYYLTYCLDTVPEKQRFLNQVEGDKCEDDTVESTFDPSACEAYTERTCTPYAAMSDAIDFITDNLGESDNNVVCQNVDGKKNEITSVVEGCVSPLAAITHFSFFHGVSLLDCTSSSLSPLEDTPLFQCVQTFVYELAESFSDPTLGGYCGAFHAFSECLDNLDDFTLEADLLKEELAWFHGLAESCQNDTEDPTSPDQGNCNTALGGHCIISYGMMHLLGPLYPDMGKTTLCPLGFESQLDINCSPFYVSCDADSNQVKRLEDMRSNLATYWDSVNICDVPEEPKWPEPKPEPEEKCEPGSALSLMSHLGLALSQCIDDHSIKDRVCWSVHTIESEIMYHIAGCSEAIQGYVLLSWRETNELATHVCKQSEHIDTPLCVPQDYSNPTETCQPGKALSCLIDLEEKVFDFDSTEERFCGYLRQDLVCYLDYTSNCDGQIKELLNPLIKVKLRQFEGRCKNTWCPIIVEPERCDVERASICMERLRTSVAKGEDGICQLAEETKMCIHRVNIDCDVEKELMLSQMLTSIQAISSIACYRPVEEPVDADGCLENLAIKMHALLNYGFDGAIIDDKVDSGNADDDDDDIDNDQDNDQDSDGDDDNNEDNGDGYDGSENGNGDDKEDGDNDNDNNEGDDNNDNDDDDNDNDDDGENDDGDDGRKKRRKRDDHADETNSKEKSASSDKTNKTPKSGSTKSSTKGTDKQSSKASDTKSTKGTKDSDKSTKSDSMKSGKSSNELVNSKSREYQDNVADMCREVEMAWMCVEDSLNVLDRQTRSVLTVLLHAMKVAVDEKCKVHHCHSCSDLSENEVCNAQPKCPCPSHQQMCYTKLEDGMLTKGCSETCEECEGKEDCYCCVGDKCNMDDSKDPDDKCDVYTAISCAFELFTITVETEEITYSAVQGKLECVLEHTKDCKSESFRQIYTICLGIVDLFQVGECVSEYGDPLCGTSAILSLGYLMRNKFADKIIICSQYEATLTAIDNVIDDEICSADNLLPITSSLDFVTSQLTGYCVPADDEAGVCEIDMAISECIQAKSWRVPADASECSDAMLEAFKQCCITYTKGCNSMQRSGIFLHVQRHLDLAWLNCPDDVITTDLDQLRAEIFLVDDYSQITYSYSEFVLKLQQAMFGSLNFNKDACQILDELQTSLAEMEQPALLKLYTQLDVESILENLEEICKDTEIGEEAVVEECQQKQLDIMLIMDGSRSIKAENFPKMKEFAVNVVKLADLESGAVRIGCVQFAELMHHQFYLNDFLEEKDGKMVQSKEKMIDFIENMVYEDNWQTNTGGALQEARTKYLTEEYGARPGTPRHILLMTDGRSKGGPDVTVEAAITRDQGIHIFTVGIRLRGKEALEEMNAIASPPASLNFLNLDDFEQLDEFYTNIFLWLCRVDTPSECDFDSIVYTLSETMMLSFTTSFSQYEDKAAICSAVQVSTTSIESLSATCAPYQIKAIEVMQAIISALNLKTCLVVTEEEAPSRPCDKKKVDECIRMSINIFSHRAIEDESVCSIVSYLTQCVDHYGAQCEDKTSIMKEIAFFTSLTWNRCPEELGHLQCWGQVVDEGDNEGANEGSEGDDQSCDLVTIATGCLVGIDTNTALDDLDFLNPCGPLVQTVDNVMTCAKDAIMTSSCDRDVFDDFMPYIMEQKEVFRGMYEAAEKLGCSVIPVELPEEYGRVEPPTCAVIRECDVMMMKDCIDGLADLSGDDCGSLESVQQCIMHVQDCNSIEYMVLMSQLRSTLMERGFSEDCLDGSNIEWRNPDGYSDSLIACVDQLSSVIKEGTKTTCEIYSEFYTCLSPILADMSGMDGLFYFGFLYYDFGLYCDGFEADTDPDVDTEDCMVDESDVTCIAQYTEVALTGPALSKWSRMELCNKFRGRLECAENIRSDCPRGTPAHRLWEIYQVTEIIVYEADICTDTPLECYPNAAMLFVSKLAETVSLHNYGSVNTEQVCRQLTVTREHLRRFLNFCGHETTGFVMATFKEIECLALDICITGGFNPEEPEEEVAECIDRNIVTGDYECDLYGVFDHLHDFWLTNGEWPFLSRSSRRTATCSDLSRIMPGVYDLINNCGPIETSLVDGLAHDLSRIMPGVYDLINNCGPIETSLVDGLAHDLSRIMPGVYDLINNCGPIETSLVDGLAHDLSRIMPGVYGLINNCGPTETSLVDGLAHDLSRIMPGVYGLINNCGPIETSLVDGLAQYAIDYAHEEGCQIEFKTPCVEEPDCGVSKARACITEFTSNLEIYIGEGAQRVCIEQDAVRRCIDASIETCSDRVKVEIEAEYSEMLTDTVCQDNFGACATKYIHYLYKILDWKAYAETEHPDEETPDTDSESTPKSDTKETGSKKSDTKETGSKKSDTKETGSKKSDTKETGSKKSDTKETGSKKSDTKETGSKKSDTKETGSKKSDTKETGSKKSDTKETGSKKSDTKETGSKKSDTKETGSKKSDTKETGSKKSDTKETGSKKTETPKTEKEVVDPERKKKLDGYCQQFELAWTCVQENWGSVGESARGFVEFSFGLYHELAMDICNGPRPGYCKITGDSVQIQGCTYDDDCGYGTQKCCKYGPGSVCVEPETTPEDCYSVFIAAVQSSVTLVQSLYENDDNGVLFCSLHSQIIEGVYSSLTIDVCPMEYTNAVFAIMAFSVEKQILFCTVPPEPPKTCIEVDMQACINTYLAAVDGVTVMQDKCSAYAVLETCVSGFMSKCDNTIEEDIIIMQSINAELTSIRTNPQSPLFCANMPSFQMSISSSTIVVKEGNMPGTDIGIKPEQNPAEICEGQGQTCEFKITYEIVENEDDMPMCSQGTRISQLLLGDFCDILFTIDNWEVEQNVTLTARIDGKIDGDVTVTLKMFVTLIVDSIEVQTVPIREYTVIVEDRDTGSICSTTNDPHVSTFDGYDFDNHMQGEFVLYKHAVLPFEVRVFYVPCFDDQSVTATCICGVSVICDDDTFVLARCYGRGDERSKLTQWPNLPLMPGFRVVKNNDGHVFNAWFPTGTRVKITLETPTLSSSIDFLNVYVYPSAVDFGQTVGLCGLYDGEKSNDLVCSDGSQKNIDDYPPVETPDSPKLRPRPDEFSDCWKVPLEDFSFEGVPASITPTELPRYCTRSGVDPDQICTCGVEDFVEQCEFQDGEDVTVSTRLGATLNKRRKRNTGSIIEGINVDINAAPPPVVVFPVNGITYAMANQTCYSALTNADFAGTCSSVLVPTDLENKVLDCVSDILYSRTLETDFIRTAVEAYREQCVAVAVTNTNTSLVQEVVSKSCRNGCSGNGNCTNGTCICNEGFVSDDCSLNINDPPQAVQLDDGLCTSLIQDACLSVRVEGNNFVRSAFCHFEQVQVTESGIVKSGNQTSVAATFDSFEEVICDVSSSGSLPLHAVLVSVSNNNGPRSSQSQQHLFLAHDPICWNCTLDGMDSGSCTRARASCLIDGVCYRPTDPKQDDPCYLCDALTGTMVYVVSDSCPAPTTTSTAGPLNSQAREMNDSTVIGISAGIAGFVLVVFVIVVTVLVIRHLNKKKSDTKSLTERSRSSGSNEDHEGFQEVVFPGYPNYGYYGYGQDMYIEAPAEMFAGGVPKRSDTRQSSSRNSDPTYQTSRDGRDHRRSRNGNRSDRH